MALADLMYVVDDPAGSPLDRKLTGTVLRAYATWPELLHVRDVKANTVSGDNSAAGTWNVRVLNTVVTNEISGASLAANQITLPAGTYRIYAAGCARQVADNRLALYNTSDTAIELLGNSEYSHATSDNATKWSRLYGRFTIAGTKVFEIQHYIAATEVAGFGTECNTGNSEIYCEVEIYREPD